MNPAVDPFFDKASPWQEAYLALRGIVLDSGLTEELKWGCPCYTSNGRNIVLIHGFKHYCALLFIQGALLKDDQHVLVQQTERVQSARQMRFSLAEDVQLHEDTIKHYIREAVAIAEAGLHVTLKTTAEYPVPAAFQRVLAYMPELRKAFQSLSPGRQRAYLLYFSSAKQDRTREARIEKQIDRILLGKGLDDR